MNVIVDNPLRTATSSNPFLVFIPDSLRYLIPILDSVRNVDQKYRSETISNPASKKQTTKNWKSFGSLEITLDASDFSHALATNLGQQTKGKLDSISVWNFSKLPSDYFEIIYKPEISGFAKIMITISPIGLTLIFALLIA
ncbi:MAG: hypothetical protein FGM61_06145, partial [Sediminibacterium sp.]|nr:hypothetical protein [Sediminibacterium sp.]